MPPDLAKRIGRQIRFLRTRKGISQTVLADQAEIARESLSRIETGSAEVSLSALLRIAKALEVKMSELLHAIGE